jgi:hypothetical protein
MLCQLALFPPHTRNTLAISLVFHRCIPRHAKCRGADFSAIVEADDAARGECRLRSFMLPRFAMVA